MKILGEELGGIGRWYLALPPILLIGFLIGLFFLAAAGQSRLNMANERLHRAQLREQALNEFAGLLTDAESAQRGYLLTGEAAYLTPYAAAVANVRGALDRLHDAYGGDDSSSEFHALRVLTGKELGELEDGVALSKKRGSAPAETFLVNGGPARVGVIGSVTRPFCGTCDRVRLTADGQVRNCLFARDESNLRDPLRHGASDDELAGIWLRAVAAKLPGHGINDPGFLQPARPMSAIGG